MYQRHLLLFLSIVCMTMVGCNSSALPPPLTITFRSSIFGLGQVAVIQNNSNHHLYNVKVVGRDLKKSQSASVRVKDHLPPGASTEVGWREFGSWVPQPGETLEFYADDFLVPKIVIVPAAQP